MGTVLNPILTSTPGNPPSYNFGMAETFSYIPVEGAGRPLYARASYITNFSDMSIHLSAGELAIGAVTIKDNNTGLNCDVVSNPETGVNALRVISQDFDAAHDSITLGDPSGTRFATIDGELSALNVKVTNQAPIISLLNALTAKEYVFQVNAENLVLPDDTNILFDTTPIETPLIQLTNVDYSTSAKQNEIITLLQQLTSHTDSFKNYSDNIEPLLSQSLLVFYSLTSLQQTEFNETQNLLIFLSGLQESKQNSLIALVQDLTGKNHSLHQSVSSILINTSDLETLLFRSNTLLNTLTAKETTNLETRLNPLTSINSSINHIENSFDISNTLLSDLTGKNHSLHQSVSSILINTSDLEILLSQSNTLLNVLTAKEVIFDTSNLETSLNPLTSILNNTMDLEVLLAQSNTLLNVLTAKEVIFDTSNLETRLNSLTSILNNTIDLEVLLAQSNTLLNVLTAKETTVQQNTSNTLLNQLTSIQTSSSEEIVTLLNQLTANTDKVESLILNSNSLLNALSSINQITKIKQDETVTLLQLLTGNSNELEFLSTQSNTLINSLTSLQQNEFNETQTILTTQSFKVSSSSLENLLQTTNTKLDSLIQRSDQQLGLMGLDILEAGVNHVGYWTTLTVISLSAKFLSLGAINSTTTNLSNYELPLTFTLSGPLTSIRLQYGAVIAYH